MEVVDEGGSDEELRQRQRQRQRKIEEIEEIQPEEKQQHGTLTSLP